MNITMNNPKVLEVIDHYIPKSFRPLIESSVKEVILLPNQRSLSFEAFLKYSPFLRLKYEHDPYVYTIATSSLFDQDERLRPNGVFIPEDSLLLVAEETPSLAYTIVHELGHAVDKSLSGPTYGSNLSTAWETSFSAKLIRPYVSKQLTKLGIDDAAAKKIFPTPYAQNNPEEFWAESFALYCKVPLDPYEPYPGHPEITNSHIRWAQIPTIVTDVFRKIEAGESVKERVKP